MRKVSASHPMMRWLLTQFMHAVVALAIAVATYATGLIGHPLLGLTAGAALASLLYISTSKPTRYTGYALIAALVLLSMPTLETTRPGWPAGIAASVIGLMVIGLYALLVDFDTLDAENQLQADLYADELAQQELDDAIEADERGHERLQRELIKIHEMREQALREIGMHPDQIDARIAATDAEIAAEEAEEAAEQAGQARA